MTPERWTQIEELFHHAAECAPERRTGVLNEACGNDPELRQEVEALLSCDGNAGNSVQAAVRGGLEGVGFPLTGETLSHYRILDGLGGGGMGLVYRAEDIKLGRRVALKFLPEESAKDPAALGRFEREARSASALEHPNICPIYEFGEHEGQPFLVMQLLEGETLRELITAAGPGKPPLELNRLLDLAIQIVDGLDAAHQKGIIHRDIKPANIFVSREGQAKILDFGLAKLASVLSGEVDESAQGPRGGGGAGITGGTAPLSTPDLFLSRTGLAMGTAGYMSPEQIRGEKLDARTDLFSFGLVLYEMATGKRAFAGDTGPELQEAILKQMPSPAREVNSELPAKLEKIISRALEKNREARYQTSSEMRVELEDLKRGTAPRGRFRRRMPASALVVFAVFILPLLTAVGYFASQHFRPRAQLPAGKIMLAVLPFQNLTGDPAQEYLTDGVTEEMITQLGRLQPERLGVIARTSVMGYKHGDERMDQIGRELGVQYILEGSVRRDGNRMRITAQLIQVKDQSHLWAREYDHSLKDLFALQDDVTAGVAEEIQSRLALEPRNRAGRNHPVTPETYDAYLLGRYSLNGRTMEGYRDAERYFHAAIAADPNYALAYTGLAESYLLMAANGSSLQAVSLQARAAANKALTIDPTLGEPHAILGLIAQNHDWNWPESEREFKLAMALDPNDATPHHWYSGNLVVRGRFEECFRELAIARQLDPLSVTIREAEGQYLYLARRYDEAIGKSDRTLEIEPNFAWAYFDRGLSYEQKGKWREALADLETAKRLDDAPFSAAVLGEAYALSGDKIRARQILRELQVRAKREDVSALYPALIYAGLGEKDSAFAGLEEAFQERATYLLALKKAPFYDPLRSDPRFDVLLKRMSLPQ